MNACVSACVCRLQPNPRADSCLRGSRSYVNPQPIDEPQDDRYPAPDDFAARVAAMATGSHIKAFKCFSRDAAGVLCGEVIQYGMKWCMACHSVYEYRHWHFALSESLGAPVVGDDPYAPLEYLGGGDAAAVQGAAAAAVGSVFSAADQEAGDGGYPAVAVKIQEQVNALISEAAARAAAAGPSWDVSRGTFAFKERIQFEWK